MRIPANRGMPACVSAARAVAEKKAVEHTQSQKIFVLMMHHKVLTTPQQSQSCPIMAKRKKEFAAKRCKRDKNGFGKKGLYHEVGEVLSRFARFFKCPSRQAQGIRRICFVPPTACNEQARDSGRVEWRRGRDLNSRYPYG